MGRLLMLAFAVLPLLEIAFFILIGRAIGLWPTLLGVLVTALLGAVIIRLQGLSLLADIRGSVRRGQLPARELADAMMVGLAGLLLLLPGYFSDLVGLLLLVPAIRTLIYGMLGRRVMAVVTSSPRTGRPGGNRVGGRGTLDLDEDQYRER